MSKSERNLVLILLCVCLVLIFFRLGARPLWNIDEGRHADTKLRLSLERNDERFETIVILKDILSQNNLTEDASPKHSGGQQKNSPDKK